MFYVVILIKNRQYHDLNYKLLLIIDKNHIMIKFNAFIAQKIGDFLMIH